MKTSFETYAQFISPWEFTIVLDGKEYPTRPFTLADVAYLQTHEKDDAANVGRLIEFVKGIFTGEVKPDVDRWPLEYMPMMLATLGAYFAEHTKKNADAIKAAVAQARATSGTASGN